VAFEPKCHCRKLVANPYEHESGCRKNPKNKKPAKPASPQSAEKQVEDHDGASADEELPPANPSDNVRGAQWIVFYFKQWLE
jgi:hypothetical protein